MKVCIKELRKEARRICREMGIDGYEDVVVVRALIKLAIPKCVEFFAEVREKMKRRDE